MRYMHTAQLWRYTFYNMWKGFYRHHVPFIDGLTTASVCLQTNPQYRATDDVRSKIKFLEGLERQEKKRKDDIEREALLKVAKSRTKAEDPEQAKLKQKAKEVNYIYF